MEPIEFSLNSIIPNYFIRDIRSVKSTQFYFIFLLFYGQNLKDNKNINYA